MINTPHTPKKRILEASVVHFEAGTRESQHRHEEHGQLKWPRTALSRIKTPAGVFVVPPTRALWIPPGEAHAGHYPHSVHEHNVYVHRDHCTDGVLPQRSAVVVVTTRLARAIIDALAREGDDVEPRERLAQDQRTLAVLREEVRDAGLAPLNIDLPDGSRLKPALEALDEHPDASGSLPEWARRLAMSPRTLSRRFQSETGMSFGTWRKRARLLHALELLAGGAEVSKVASELGYRSDSAFIYMFRTTLGTTPSRYYDALTPKS